MFYPKNIFYLSILIFTHHVQTNVASLEYWKNYSITTNFKANIVSETFPCVFCPQKEQVQNVASPHLNQ